MRWGRTRAGLEPLRDALVCSCCISVAALRSSGSATTARRACSDLRFSFTSCFGLDAKGSAACSALGMASGWKRRLCTAERTEDIRGRCAPEGPRASVEVAYVVRSTGLYSESLCSGGATPLSARVSPAVRIRRKPARRPSALATSSDVMTW